MSILAMIKDVALPIATFCFGYVAAKRALTEPHRQTLYSKQLEVVSEVMLAAHKASDLTGPQETVQAWEAFTEAWNKYSIFLPDSANHALLMLYSAFGQRVKHAESNQKDRGDAYHNMLEALRDVEVEMRMVIGVEPLSQATRNAINGVAQER